MGVFRGLALDNKRNRRFRNGGFFYYCFCLWVSRLLYNFANRNRSFGNRGFYSRGVAELARLPHWAVVEPQGRE